MGAMLLPPLLQVSSDWEQIVQEESRLLEVDQLQLGAAIGKLLWWLVLERQVLGQRSDPIAPELERIQQEADKLQLKAPWQLVVVAAENTRLAAVFVRSVLPDSKRRSPSYRFRQTDAVGD